MPNQLDLGKDDTGRRAWCEGHGSFNHADEQQAVTEPNLRHAPTTVALSTTSGKGNSHIMTKFNTPTTRPATGHGPVTAETTPSTHTHEGGPGYRHDTKSELFLLAVSNMVGETTFYETTTTRDSRYQQLIHTVAIADTTWTTKFLTWLRRDGNMRSASLVGALEATKALVGAGLPGGRHIVASVLQRADEPGEALAYWHSHHGRSIPKPVKRGVADAARRLYTPYSMLKYDTASHAVRFGDVIDLTHPTPSHPSQGALFQAALDRRHQRDKITFVSMLVANATLRKAAANNPTALMNTDALRTAGMTWEDALSLAGNRIDKARLWEALIPSMGYMALLRNLRNFDESGIPDEVALEVAARLANPDEVTRSRQFPYRFLAAYEQAPSLRWGQALDQALAASLRNIPTLSGRTLVLVDTSGSMSSCGLSAKSTMSPAKAAAVFGVALAAKGTADLWGWASGQFRHTVPQGGSVIREVDRFVSRLGEVGHGTDMVSAVRRTLHPNHNRVVIISDMQTIGDGYYQWGVTNIVPEEVPLYGFNLGGYQASAIPAGTTNRVEFGGLTDATFRMLPLLEAGRDGVWPWDQ